MGRMLCRGRSRFHQRHFARFATGRMSFAISSDETHERRRGYVAITLRQTPTGDYEGFHEFEFTMGAFFGLRNAGFFGVMLPFSDTFHVMAEHNGDQISVGADFLGPKGVNFRLVVRAHETLLGVSTTTRF